MSANRIVRNDSRNSNPQTTPTCRNWQPRRSKYDYALDGVVRDDELVDDLCIDSTANGEMRQAFKQNGSPGARPSRSSEDGTPYRIYDNAKNSNEPDTPHLAFANLRTTQQFWLR